MLPLTFLLVCALPVVGKKVVVLNRAVSAEVQIDSSYFFTFDSVQSKSSTPLNTNKHFFYNPDNNAVWFRIAVRNESDTTVEWLLLSHFYSIAEIDIYVKHADKRVEHFLFRDTMNLYDRMIVHKHPTFNMLFSKGEEAEVLFRIKNENSFEYPMVFMTRDSFESKFFTEYVIYGLFYGFLSFVFLYCLLNLVFFRDVVVMYYIFFILSQILYMLFRDGLGLYFIPFATEYADLLHNIFLVSVSVSLLFYTSFFLRIRKNTTTFKVILALALFRIILGIVELKQTSLITFHVEFLIITVSLLLTFRFYKRVHSDARYISMGLSFLFVIYLFNYVSIFGLIPYTTLTFWSLYIGFAGENIFFMLALTERFKRARIERYRQEQMNRELEHLVEQRTETVQLQNRLLESQSKELNLFLYSASHDLKGPLKTIEGLCNVGTLDSTADHKLIFEMIRTKLRKLESNINDLNAVTKLKYSTNAALPLSMETVHQDILDRFEKYPGMESIRIESDIQFKEAVLLDGFTIRSIYQNIVENSIKYRDRSKPLSKLMIRIFKLDSNMVIRFEDNGQGIASDKISKIFEMFYRGNEESREDTGLGLYIVKLAVEKLGGSISVDSTLGEGTSFEVRVPV